MGKLKLRFTGIGAPPCCVELREGRDGAAGVWERVAAESSPALCSGGESNLLWDSQIPMSAGQGSAPRVTSQLLPLVMALLPLVTLLLQC